jgi:hypothetical protein
MIFSPKTNITIKVSGLRPLYGPELKDPYVIDISDSVFVIETSNANVTVSGSWDEILSFCVEISARMMAWAVVNDRREWIEKFSQVVSNTQGEHDGSSGDDSRSGS